MDKVKELREIYSAQSIQARVRELADEIGRDYGGRPFTAVCVLNGAFMFFGDLIRHIKSDLLEVSFMRLSSYGGGTESSQDVKILYGPEIGLEGRDVLIVDDILDTGLSMEKAIGYIKDKGAGQVRVCVMIDKLQRRISQNVRPDYSGFRLDRGFIVGYGLDLDDRYRNLDAIYEVVFEQSHGT